MDDDLRRMLDEAMPRELRRTLQTWYKQSPLNYVTALQVICAAILGIRIKVVEVPLAVEERETMDQKLGLEDAGTMQVIPFRPKAPAASDPVIAGVDVDEEIIGLA